MGVAVPARARDRLLSAATATADADAVRVCREILLAVREVAPHEAAAVMTTDPATTLPAGGVVSGFPTSACGPFWDSELLDPDVDKFVDLARSPDPVATLADTTAGELHRSARYRRLYQGYGASDELRVAFTAGHACLAIGCFLRCDGMVFTPLEVREVRQLVAPAVAALRATVAAAAILPAASGPVVLLLARDGSLVSASRDAETVLDDLRVQGLGETVPGTVLVLAGRVRDGGGATTRLRGRSGRWFRVHAAALSGDLDGVSVTVEAAGAGDLAPVLLDAAGMTPREADVVLAVCRGLADKEIARELGLSVHTVRDYVKAVFAKVGVNSRGELVGTLFTRHLLGPVHEAILPV